MGDLAVTLGGMLDRAVINRTRWSGQYEITLNWGADGLANSRSQAASDLPPILPPSKSSWD